ncbi:TPA: ATP-binding cassette domain-containing protein [Klebsiella pneumoniae]|nr:ATP-binding cassette domain-containing protein [Klebsiella pneumoniae]
MTTMPQRESTIAVPDDRRKQLGAFLRARRESLDPQRLGLPRVGRRRTPGLRREEVAMLADVGVTWYTWLEQGREVNPSEAVLVGVANALQCSPLETRHLFVLAGLTPPEATQVTVCEGISPGTRRMLDSLMPQPASIQKPNFDIVAWNDSINIDLGGPAQPLLKVNHLLKYFRGGKGREVVQAVDDISFTVMKGETLGVVGESGCGKSTTARLLMQLLTQDSGELIFDGQGVGSSRLPLKAYRRQVQMVFQDSYASLNPRLTMEESIAFGQRVHGVSAREASEYARYLLAHVGLEPARFADRYPHALSGGQRQRVNIARALAMKPRLVILDEAVSALDKSVEAQVLQLLQELKRTLELTYVFISHDLHVVRWLSDRILVMYLGEVVEIGPAEQLFTASAHPYTRALLSSMPSMDPENRTLTSPLSGDPPSPIAPPSGCRFHTRCPHAKAVCAEVKPRLEAVGEGHQSACLMAQPASPWHQSIPLKEVSHVG